MGGSGASGENGTNDARDRDSGPSPDAGDGGNGSKSAMTFFATSTGSGTEGGNLGGLAGADAKCLALATAVGGGDHTWKAYLSTNTNAGGMLVNAKDRVGAGPWKNQKGTVVASNVAALHAATFTIKTVDVLDEKGMTVPTMGPNRHDMLTGTIADGTASPNQNCANWTSKANNASALVGHSDGQTGTGKWNSAHGVNGCSSNTFSGSGGEGRFYCFAAD